MLFLWVNASCFVIYTTLALILLLYKLRGVPIEARTRNNVAAYIFTFFCKFSPELNQLVIYS